MLLILLPLSSEIYICCLHGVVIGASVLCESCWTVVRKIAYHVKSSFGAFSVEPQYGFILWPIDYDRISGKVPLSTYWSHSLSCRNTLFDNAATASGGSLFGGWASRIISALGYYIVNCKHLKNVIDPDTTRSYLGLLLRLVGIILLCGDWNDRSRGEAFSEKMKQPKGCSFVYSIRHTHQFICWQKTKSRHRVEWNRLFATPFLQGDSMKSQSV